MQTTDNRLTESKTQVLIETGLKVSGYVLFNPSTNSRTFVEFGAVRQITNAEMWVLMHPNDRLSLTSEVIEQCARVVEPQDDEPCDCDICLCDNVARRDRQIVWQLRKYLAEQIRAQKRPAPEIEPQCVEFDGQQHAVTPCPFCGGGTFDVRVHRVWIGSRFSEPSSVEIIHWCEPVTGQPSRSIVRVGRNFQSALDAWNRRTIARNIP